jgi:hypothetical protein
MARENLALTPVLPLEASGQLVLREGFGLDHRAQVVAFSCPPGLPASVENFSLREAASGNIFPAQRSRENPAVAFVRLGFTARQEYRLSAQTTPTAEYAPITLVRTEDGRTIISNGCWSVDVFLGEWNATGQDDSLFTAPTPIRRMKSADGPWRGRLFFETHRPVHRATGRLIESGPLRIVTEFEAQMDANHSYLARLTFDAEADHVVIEETFDGHSGDQLVWDFTGADLPEEVYLLDSTANFSTQTLHYFFDRRLARLACWNQYSQLHDFSDGYALGFARGTDVLGFVALRGGMWRGNAHNFLEAWTRRWLPGDPLSRRLVPSEAKSDAAPSPETIPARPANRCESHFSVEGWIHRGRRQFALVLTSRDRLRPTDWNASPSLGHFETEPDRARYRQQQSLLRRIHTQIGLLPLAEQLLLKPDAAVPTTSTDIPPWDNPDNHYTTSNQTRPESIPERIEQMRDFLAARVYGFWEGSGAAYSNAVVSRRLVHDLLDWEWLQAHGHLDAGTSRQLRAWFLFLSELFFSDSYYPGPASMNLGDTDQRLEPTIAGIANQNFFTDVFCLHGMAAQIFPQHPQAAVWRERFAAMWQRQLEYHVYPDSGVWEESHTYFHHVLMTVLPVIERRLADGVEDGFADARFQKLVGSLLKTLTPRDACFDGKRHVVALGDHGVDPNDLYRPLFSRLSRHLARHNPSLAAQLAWAYREMDGPGTLPVEPAPIAWASEHVQGLGFFFRSQDPQGESLLVLRSGSAWGHHHNDEGGLQFFHAGRAWIVDSAFGNNQSEGIRKFRADGHSRWAPRDFAPLNYLWQFNRGWITQHNSTGVYPWATAFTPIYMAETNVLQHVPLRHPVRHWRAVLQLSPSAFVVFDRTDIRLPEVVRLHVPIDAPLALEDAALPTASPFLRVRALEGLHAPQIATIDRPTQAPESYSTREVRFDATGAPVMAHLFAIEAKTSDAIHLNRDGACVTLHHRDFDLQFDFAHSAAVRLSDLRHQTEESIPLA